MVFRLSISLKYAPHTDRSMVNHRKLLPSDYSRRCSGVDPEILCTDALRHLEGLYKWGLSIFSSSPNRKTPFISPFECLTAPACEISGSYYRKRREQSTILCVQVWRDASEYLIIVCYGRFLSRSSLNRPLGISFSCHETKHGIDVRWTTLGWVESDFSILK